MGLKKSSSLILVLFFGVMISLPSTSIGQSPLSQKQWEELTDELDYGDIENPEPQEIIEEEDNEGWEGFSLPPGVLQVIVISLVVIGLTLLLVRILGNRTPNAKIRKQKKVFSIQEAEEDLEESDLNSLLNDFLDRGDFRSAMRIMYLRVLQRLSHLDLILWRKEKTNFDYVRELSDPLVQANLAALTSSFEFYWYGEQNPTAKNFENTLEQSEQLLSKLGHEERD